LCTKFYDEGNGNNSSGIQNGTEKQAHHPGALFHSDRGVQYACNEFKHLLDNSPLVTRSMGRKGNCWDNAVTESFFKTLKAECVYQNKYTSLEQAALIVFEYIEIWYHRKRLHSTLGYIVATGF